MTTVVLGFAYYDVFVSDNGSEFTAFLARTTATSAVFTGDYLHRYSFYTVATDHVGNRQVVTTKRTTTIANQPPVIGAFDTSVTYTENGPAVLIDSNATITDPDSANFWSGKLTVAITSNAQSTDRIGIRQQAQGQARLAS